MTGEPGSRPLELSIHEVAEIIRTGGEARLLDVRQPWECEIASIEGAERLDEDIADELLRTGDRSARYIFICHHGIRSLSAAAFFANQGFDRAYSMSGGIDAWSLEVDTEIPRY